jgi:SAM-dependent methyltransferase
MIFKIIDPQLPSISRYRDLFSNKYFSLTRELQYEILKNLTLNGCVLDFGGGEKARYRAMISCDSYESVNIDSEMNPTWVTTLNTKLPCSSNSYDTVFSLNTLEHVFDVRFVLKDISRVLKNGGEFVCAVPFLYPVHAHPFDYFRPTPSWWIEALEQAGFKEVTIMPLVWGPFSTGTVCSGLPGPFKRIRLHLSLVMDILYAKCRYRRKQKAYSGALGKNIQNHALCFFVRAKKED